MTGESVEENSESLLVLDVAGDVLLAVVDDMDVDPDRLLCCCFANLPREFLFPNVTNEEVWLVTVVNRPAVELLLDSVSVSVCSYRGDDSFSTLSLAGSFTRGFVNETDEDFFSLSC